MGVHRLLRQMSSGSLARTWVDARENETVITGTLTVFHRLAACGAGNPPASWHCDPEYWAQPGRSLENLTRYEQRA